MAQAPADAAPALPVEPPVATPGARAVPADPKRLLLVFAASVGFVYLADWLFWHRPRGWTLGAYGFVLAVAILVSGNRFRPTRSALLILAALVALFVQCVDEPGALAIAMSLLGLVTLGLIVREGWVAGARAWAQRWGLFVLLGWCCPFQDLRAWNQYQRSNHGVSRGVTRLLRYWAIPVLLGVVFAILFAVGNPVISQWLTDGWRNLHTWLKRLFDRFPSAPRMLFWFLTAAAVWTLLRFRSARHARAQKQAAAPDLSNAPFESPVAARPLASGFTAFPYASFVVRCLVLFNAIFGVQTVLDVRYLWGGAALPAGLTYAEYAHRGAYPLIAAAILAAIFVLVTFGDHSHERPMRWARRLVYVWLAQNLFLVVSAVWRLRLYVDAYSLTRLRVAAGIWMLLVLCGLAWILLRIMLRRSNTWLLNVNTITALAVLYACCFVNFDGRIADFNVAHCAELHGAGPPIDLYYLRTLGPETLPALTRLRRALTDPIRTSEIAGVINALNGDLRSEVADWRGWTWRRFRLARESTRSSPYTAP